MRVKCECEVAERLCEAVCNYTVSIHPSKLPAAALTRVKVEAMIIRVRTIVVIPVMILLMCLTAIMNIIFVAHLPNNVNGGLRVTSLTDPLALCSDKDFSHNNKLVKETNATGIACPIFRDEEGFLSEFIAYYQLHGITHIKLYNDGSTDNSLLEIEPWIKTGFVSVEYNVSALFQEALAVEAEAETWEWYSKVLEHGERIAMQFFAHDHCKEFAIVHGYEYMFTLDIDEYMVPHQPGVTVMDAVADLSLNTPALIFPTQRVNFASTPHTLEPIDLLTIEAYHYRMAVYGRMNYFRAVQPKLYFRLQKNASDESYNTFIRSCCDIHSCALNCSDQAPEVLQHQHSVFNPKLPPSSPSATVAIFHYARSLEKYDLKQRTWASYNKMSYSLTEYLDRNLGRTHDTRASSRYSCQVRQILREMTQEKTYLRPGSQWYRNVEYNRSLTDEEKVNFEHLKTTTITDFTNFTGSVYRAMVERGPSSKK